MIADILMIKGLVLETRIGVYDWEKLARQSLVLDLELFMPSVMITKAADSDNVLDALDYVAVTQRIQQMASESSCQLIETFAETLTAILLAEFPRIHKLKLAVHKPAAIASADDVILMLERSR